MGELRRNDPKTPQTSWQYRRSMNRASGVSTARHLTALLDEIPREPALNPTGNMKGEAQHAPRGIIRRM